MVERAGELTPKINNEPLPKHLQALKYWLRSVQTREGSVRLFYDNVLKYIERDAQVLNIHIDNDQGIEIDPQSGLYTPPSFLEYKSLSLTNGVQMIEQKREIKRLIRPMEGKVLGMLMEQPEKPIHREYLLRMVFAASDSVRTIDQHVSNLRKALQESAFENNDRFVQTVWGYGYILNTPKAFLA